MKDDGFLKMIHTELPPEAELAIELRCREVWACEDIKQVKAFCIDMMKNHARAEAVLSKAMKRLIVDLLKAIAKQTDNSIDDQAVDFIEARMFPGSTTTLQ